MVKSYLSDQEITAVTAMVVAQDINGIVKYLNRLFYQKARGTDTCARPLAARDERDMQHPCFAMGYLQKIQDFIVQTDARETEKERVIQKTLNYISKLMEEIKKFFPKKEGI